MRTSANNVERVDFEAQLSDERVLDAWASGIDAEWPVPASIARYLQ